MYDPYEGEPREYDVQRVLSINVDARHYLRVVDSLALTAALAPDNLNRVLAHESLTDGITDREAYILSFVGWVYWFRTSGAPNFINNESAVFNEIQVSNTEVKIIHMEQTFNEELNDYIVNSLVELEELMGAPYLEKELTIYMFDPRGAYEGYTNSLTAGAWTPLSLWVQEPVAFENLCVLYRVYYHAECSAPLGLVVAYALAHAYLNHSYKNHPYWLSEGGAKFLAYLVLGHTKEDIRVRIRPDSTCALAFNTIEKSAGAGAAGRHCGYGHGAGLFIELFQRMEASAFMSAWKEFYHLLETSSLPVIENLKVAFNYRGDDLVRNVVDRRYYGR